MTLGETTDTSAATPADFSVVVPNSQFCCFVCGAPRPLAELKVLRTTAKSTRTGQAAEMLLPCLTQLDCAPGASGLNEHDGAQCCQLCFDDLKLQWDGFEHVRVPLSGRSFIVLRGLWSAVSFSFFFLFLSSLLCLFHCYFLHIMRLCSNCLMAKCFFFFFFFFASIYFTRMAR